MVRKFVNHIIFYLESDNSMNRRKFVALSLSGIAAISIGSMYGCAHGSINPLIAEPESMGHFTDGKSIRETGVEYLKKMPAENDPKKLQQLIAGDNMAIINSSDKNGINIYLDKKIRDDFESGRIITVNGWILSQTEARQCALFTFIQQ